MAPEFEPSIDIQNWPNIEIIKTLKEKKCIINTSPLWWSTENTPDPREFMSFETFLNRIVDVGKTYSVVTFREKEMEIPQTYLYPKPQVPMTILELEIDSQKMPFLITARPFNLVEDYQDPFEEFLHKYGNVNKLMNALKKGAKVSLLDHFRPHIRGLYAGKRNENIFWYPLLYSDKYDLGEIIKNGLKKRNLSFIDTYGIAYNGNPWGSRRYLDAWVELKCSGNKNIDLKTLCRPDFNYKEVSVEEFLEDYQKEENLLVYYPFHVDGYNYQWTIVLSNKTHYAGKLQTPVVLGFYIDNGSLGFANRHGIARIKNKDFAKLINNTLSKDIGINISTVLFTPQRGRPKYELIGQTY